MPEHVIFKLGKGLSSWLPRHQDEIGCPVCRKGVAEQVMTTREERIEFGCRIDGDEECCARAFVCTLCGARILASAEPPEPSWDYE